MLILVVGPSGAGKDTLLNGARRALADAPVRFVRRVITRTQDADDEPSTEAHDSVTEQAFAALQAGGGFALHWRAHGLLYGIPSDIGVDVAQGRAVVANVSRAVVAEAAARFPVGVVEISAPADTLARRLAARGREDAVDMARRLSRSIELPLPVMRERVMNDGTVEAGVRLFVAAIRRLAGPALPA